MKLFFRASLVLASACLMSACGSLLPSPPPTPSFFTLSSSAVKVLREQAARSDGPSLLVNPMRASSGFDSTHMVYTRSPQQLEYFARSEWADTPARMLGALLVEVLSDELLPRAGAAAAVGAVNLGAVVQAPTSAITDFSIDTDLIRLQQNFSVQPSTVRLTLRATLIQTGTRRVLAVREFDATLPAPSDDPRGGVQAAQAASLQVMKEVAEFCKAALR